jgi:hypothetical protein
MVAVVVVMMMIAAVLFVEDYMGTGHGCTPSH